MQEPDVQKIEELLNRGVDEVIGDDALRASLEAGKKLTIKLGVDPTSPHLHLGRTVPLLKLRDFQELGHNIVFVVGDFTGVIGDTSDKESERPMLDEETIETNKERYFKQVGMLVDLDKAEFRYNSEWLGTLTYKEVGEHANQFSVADFIARDNIKRRLDAGKRVSLREVLYPLMQGYDSVELKADVEVGGSDQRFNMLAGRTLQEHFNQAPQAVITNPLIAGTDGRKMSSSWGNTINLTDEPNDMYGKVMRVHDNLIIEYFTLLTRVPLGDVEQLRAGLEHGDLHPRDVKMQLAHAIVSLYHGDTVADEAQHVFQHVFQEQQIPDDIPEVSVASGTALVEVLMDAGVVASKSEWRRLVEGGAVKGVGDATAVVSDTTCVVTEPSTYKIGKRRFVRINTT